MKLYNTLTREKDELKPPSEQKNINLFVCGPTVYDYAHIGHARTYIFFDFFVKYLRSQGYEVIYLQNITDIDDKIIRRADEQEKNPLKLAKEFTQAYFDDMKALGVDAVSQYAAATDFIPEIISQVNRLIEKNFVYKIDGDGWYFDISKDAEYGKLSGRTVVQAEDGVSRIDDAIGKKHKGDFCVWKFWTGSESEPKWETLLGAGRPGWHIEDTAITEKFFGPHYDIHGGGVDLKFPHHEAEIAQQESLREPGDTEPLAKIWMHTGALLVDGKKMSKSLNNFVTIRDFLKGSDADVLRWITLTHHYRSPVDYSTESILQATSAIKNIKLFLAKLMFFSKDKPEKNNAAIDSLLEKFDFTFLTALSDDINSPMAIGSMFDVVSELQLVVSDLGPEISQKIYQSFKKKMAMFGFSLELPIIPAEIQAKANDRELSRANKQFEQSDTLRKEINDLGYEVEDTPIGPFLWPK